jgi:toxin ParE1/3/4
VAEQNRANQLAYIGERNPLAAIRLGDTIASAVNHLSDYPKMGRLGRVSGTRELVVHGTPYVIAYRIEPEAIVILRLLHGAQRWPTSL